MWRAPTETERIGIGSIDCVLSDPRHASTIDLVSKEGLHSSRPLIVLTRMGDGACAHCRGSVANRTAEKLRTDPFPMPPNCPLPDWSTRQTGRRGAATHSKEIDRLASVLNVLFLNDKVRKIPACRELEAVETGRFRVHACERHLCRYRDRGERERSAEAQLPISAAAKVSPVNPKRARRTWLPSPGLDPPASLQACASRPRQSQRS